MGAAAEVRGERSGPAREGVLHAPQGPLRACGIDLPRVLCAGGQVAVGGPQRPPQLHAELEQGGGVEVELVGLGRLDLLTRLEVDDLQASIVGLVDRVDAASDDLSVLGLHNERQLDHQLARRQRELANQGAENLQRELTQKLAALAEKQKDLALQAGKLGDETAPDGPEGMYQFPPGTTLTPGERFVVARSGTAYFTKYGQEADAELAGYEVPDVVRDRVVSTLESEFEERVNAIRAEYEAKLEALKASYPTVIARKLAERFDQLPCGITSWEKRVAEDHERAPIPRVRLDLRREDVCGESLRRGRNTAHSSVKRLCVRWPGLETLPGGRCHGTHGCLWCFEGGRRTAGRRRSHPRMHRRPRAQRRRVPPPAPSGAARTNQPSRRPSRAAARFGARLRLFTDPADAVAGVDAVYTDTWTSMGRESEADVRRRVFANYQVNDALMSLAKPGAFFMHCLPAHRGEEVTSDVFESPVSVVFDQAENRLHCQKALLLMLLAPASA